MSKTGRAMVKVKVTQSAYRDTQEHSRLQVLDVPPRSKLYGLVPYGMETVWSESLTSYMNRLGWRHGVSPRALVAEVVAPHLKHEQLGPYFSSSIGLLGYSDIATTG